MYINTGRRMVWLNMLFWLRPVPVFDGHRTERHQELPHVQVAKSQKIGEQASKSWNILKILLKILLNIHKHLILLNIFDFQRYAAAFFLCHSPGGEPIRNGGWFPIRSLRDQRVRWGPAAVRNAQALRKRRKTRKIHWLMIFVGDLLICWHYLKCFFWLNWLFFDFDWLKWLQ